jgi:hypothetical protein
MHFDTILGAVHYGEIMIPPRGRNFDINTVSSERVACSVKWNSGTNSVLNCRAEDSIKPQDWTEIHENDV